MLTLTRNSNARQAKVNWPMENIVLVHKELFAAKEEAGIKNASGRWVVAIDFPTKHLTPISPRQVRSFWCQLCRYFTTHSSAWLGRAVLAKVLSSPGSNYCWTWFDRSCLCISTLLFWYWVHSSCWLCRIGLNWYSTVSNLGCVCLEIRFLHGIDIDQPPPDLNLGWIQPYGSHLCRMVVREIHI